MQIKKSILLLPRWYPNKTDIQLGTFIRQQALLLKDDFDISVIYVQADTAKEKFNLVENTKDGIHEIVVYFKEGKGFFKKIINAKRYAKAQKLAYKKLNRQFDLCHVLVPYRSAPLALYLLRISKIPFVATEHWSGHLTGDFQKKNKLDKILYKRILKKASAISCVSQLLQKKFKLNTGFDSVVIPNFIETLPASVTATAAPNKKLASIKILSVTDMADEIKNISGLITAFNYALQENNNLHLTIVGGGPDEEKIKKLVNQFQLSSHITLTGRLDHEAVLKEMQQCNFYVCNSNTETFGMTVAEALRSGKPVISTKCGGPEEFLNRENSILVEPKNNDQLKNAILQMADEFSKYNSQKLSEEMENKFGKETVKGKWISFYQSVLK